VNHRVEGVLLQVADDDLVNGRVEVLDDVAQQIGRGVWMFSICSAIAFASNTPTQIGNTFWPSVSLKMMIGMLVMGSTINPLMFISIITGPAVVRSSGT
jgi:hypothetical protein